MLVEFEDNDLWHDVADWLCEHPIFQNQPDLHILTDFLMGNVLNFTGDFEEEFKCGELPDYIAYIGKGKLGEFRQIVHDTYGWNKSDIKNHGRGFISFAADKIVKMTLLGYPVLTVHQAVMRMLVPAESVDKPC